MGLCWILIVIAVVITRGHAQEPRVVRVCPVVRVTHPPVLDGWLDDACWRAAPSANMFCESRSGKVADEAQTYFFLVFTEAALFLGVKCLEPHMHTLKATVTTDDGEVWSDDCVEIFIDCQHDHATYFQFVVNALGTRFDRTDAEYLWSGDWTARAHRHEDCWTVEVMLPFATLGMAPPKDGDIWGFNLCRERYTQGRVELTQWSPTGGNYHRPDLFGHMLFVPQLGADSVRQWLSPLIREHGELQVEMNDLLLFAGADKAATRTFREMLHVAITTRVPDFEEFRRVAARDRRHPFEAQSAPLIAAWEKLKQEGLSEVPLSSAEFGKLHTQLQQLHRQAVELTWEIKLYILLHEE